MAASRQDFATVHACGGQVSIKQGRYEQAGCGGQGSSKWAPFVLESRWRPASNGGRQQAASLGNTLWQPCRLTVGAPPGSELVAASRKATPPSPTFTFPCPSLS